MRKLILVGLLTLLIAASIFAGNFFDNPATSVLTLPKETISQNELKGILLMREEEKLARDVYLTLYEKWKIQIFYNIAQSEQKHMNAVKALIDKYNLEDPIADDKIGVFRNVELQKLYHELVEQGEKSYIDALKVGATIEDLDIYDLTKLLNETDNQDIKLVYENLKLGSENHMRAFVSQLEKHGSSYSPKYTSEDDYLKIINTSTGKSRENGKNTK